MFTRRELQRLFAHYLAAVCVHVIILLWWLIYSDGNYPVDICVRGFQEGVYDIFGIGSKFDCYLNLGSFLLYLCIGALFVMPFSMAAIELVFVVRRRRQSESRNLQATIH